jgi:hypothetical protein
MVLFLDSISILPHHHTPSPPPAELPADDKMIESLSEDHLNGHEDVVMDEANDGATPGISADFSMASLEAVSTSTTRSYPEDGDDQEPPAKRARLTDTDMASIAPVSYCLSLSFVRVFVAGVLISVSHASFASQVRNPASRLS